MVGGTNTNAVKPAWIKTNKISMKMWSGQPDSLRMDNGDQFAGL